jgi:SAM-dependent methyltransferase
MRIGEQIRRVYEKHPYPSAEKSILRRALWPLPPVEWINAMWQPGRVSPDRILVAGCGTGAEAFALRRRFSRAEIVAVDFSPRSIAIARDMQARVPKMNDIRFLAGDFTSPQFPKSVGCDFTFISCHGVLSYVPQPGRALRNFVRCLTPDGALYLGVNGSAHYSGAWRRALPAFGFEMADFRDGRRLRDILRLCDAVAGQDVPPIGKLPASYLASDLFGSLIHNLPLAEWIQLTRHAGLHFLGSFSAMHQLRPALNNGSYRLLIPRSRAEVAEFLDVMAPSSFHRLVFSRTAPVNPPWENPEALLDWRPLLTPVYLGRWPKGKGSSKSLRNLKIKSTATNTLIELCVPEWELEILRQSEGKQTLRKILASCVPAIKPQVLQQQLYLFYQLAVINLLHFRSNSRSRAA